MNSIFLLHKFPIARLKIASKVDFLAGLLFAAFGAAALVLSRNYSVGSGAQMGPGYYPKVLGVILVVLGAAIALRAVARVGPESRRIAFKPLVWILGSVTLFALSLNVLGIALAGVLLIIGCRLAGADFRIREVLISAIVLVGAAIAIFGYGLAIPFKIWPF